MAFEDGHDSRIHRGAQGRMRSCTRSVAAGYGLSIEWETSDGDSSRLCNVALSRPDSPATRRAGSPGA
jgi:hypothetical protein